MLDFIFGINLISIKQFSESFLFAFSQKINIRFMIILCSIVNLYKRNETKESLSTWFRIMNSILIIITNDNFSIDNEMNNYVKSSTVKY